MGGSSRCPGMPCRFLVDLCSSDRAWRHRDCTVGKTAIPVSGDSFLPTEAPGPPPGSLLTPMFALRLTLPPGRRAQEVTRGREESPSQDRVGSTLTSSGLSPPKCIRDVERLPSGEWGNWTKLVF